tara:strand:- start:5326 stop:5832 length:507 start_codon:yes stop_codon:yes gene_type:complete
VYQNKDHTNQKLIVTKSNNIDISNQKNLIEIAKKISKLIEKGDNLFLSGELGVGKTTFAKFLINNLQLKHDISTFEILSPTFNILNEYQIKNLKVKHYDLYRIKQIEELDNLGLFEEKDDINIIEWPEILKSYRIKNIKFGFSYSKNYEKRSLIISSNYNNKIINEFK